MAGRKKITNRQAHADAYLAAAEAMEIHLEKAHARNGWEPEKLAAYLLIRDGLLRNGRALAGRPLTRPPEECGDRCGGETCKLSEGHNGVHRNGGLWWER